jgi:hypothetical protein
VREFHYRVTFAARDPRPGYHRSAVAGAGFEFSGHVPLTAASDARRLDIRASLTRPFQDWVARRHRQRGVVDVWLVADLSASIGFRGARDKTETLAQLTAAVGYSAWRTGDRFGFVGCADGVLRDWYLPPTRQAAIGEVLARRLRAARLQGGSPEAFARVAAFLGTRRALVLLASDWHLPLGAFDLTLATLARHDVVPIVLWDRRELDPGAGFGIARLRDPESGAVRTLVLRPSLRARMAEAMDRRRAAIEAACRKHGRRPVFLLDGFDADALTAHFHGRGAQ